MSQSQNLNLVEVSKDRHKTGRRGLVVRVLSSGVEIRGFKTRVRGSSSFFLLLPSVCAFVHDSSGFLLLSGVYFATFDFSSFLFFKP